MSTSRRKPRRFGPAGRLSRVLVALVAVVATASACGLVHVRQPTGGGVEHGGQIRLAVIPKAIGFDFWENVRVGAECAADRYGDSVRVHWDGVTEESDVSGQQSLLQDLLAQGVNGLIYAATDAKALADVTKTALQQGTTVVNMDSGTEPQPQQAPVFGTDNALAAERGADLLARQLGGTGEVGYVEFQPGTNTSDSRGEGFRQGLANHPGVRVVAQQSSESDYSTALQVSSDILTAHPELDAIYAGNEPSTLGAAAAVQQAGKADRVKIVGWDTSDEQIKLLRQGVITGLIGQNPFRMGFDSVHAAVAMIREGKRPPGRDTGATVITRDNVDSPEVQTLLNPTCARQPR